MDSNSDALTHSNLLSTELLSVPLEHWGFFFPGHLAVWRFIQSKRPGALGELSAGYDEEPYFKGNGASWFCESLGNDEEYLRLLESIMYPLAAALPRRALERGFVRADELPPLHHATIGALATVALDRTNRALNSGELTK